MNLFDRSNDLPTATGLPTKEGFRDDCTEFILSIFLYLGFSANLNCFLSLQCQIHRPLKDKIQDLT